MKLFSSRVSEMDIYQKAEHVEWKIVENRMVLIDGREMELFHLNEVGAAVWELIDGKKRVKEIETKVAAEFVAPLKQIHHDVTDFMKKLLERELITRKND